MNLLPTRLQPMVKVKATFDKSSCFYSSMSACLSPLSTIEIMVISTTSGGAALSCQFFLRPSVNRKADSIS